jgi:phage terminase large subunit-like protein
MHYSSAEPDRRAMWEQRKVHHVGNFPVLEDQMCAFTSDFDRGRKW